MQAVADDKICDKWAKKSIAIFKATGAKMIINPRIKMGEVVPGFSIKYFGIILDMKFLWVDHAVSILGRIYLAVTQSHGWKNLGIKLTVLC